MKAIIFLVSRSRFVIPRVGSFLYAQEFAAATYPHQPFVYQGRALDMAEFNEAAARLLDTRNAHLGYEVSVRLLEATVKAAKPVKVVEAVETVEPVEAVEPAPPIAKKRASKARAAAETEIE